MFFPARVTQPQGVPDMQDGARLAEGTHSSWRCDTEPSGGAGLESSGVSQADAGAALGPAGPPRCPGPRLCPGVGDGPSHWEHRPPRRPSICSTEQAGRNPVSGARHSTRGVRLLVSPSARHSPGRGPRGGTTHSASPPAASQPSGEGVRHVPCRAADRWTDRRAVGKAGSRRRGGRGRGGQSSPHVASQKVSPPQIHLDLCVP